MKRNAELRNYSFDYDPENDSLFLYDPSRKSNSSIELDNLVLDFTSKGYVCAMEIFNASDFFEKMTEGDFTLDKRALESLTGCKLALDYQTNMVLIRLLLFVNEKRVRTNLALPIVTQSSPALNVK